MEQVHTQTPTPTSTYCTTTKTFAFPNGAIKKHHLNPTPEYHLYRDCLRNHAASLGGHALDGCGEFMPSPSANPADPTSLRCAACGCHRNFHRRINPQQPVNIDNEVDEEDNKDEEKSVQQDGENNHNRRTAEDPHMLMTLGSGHTPATVRKAESFSKDDEDEEDQDNQDNDRRAEAPQMLMALSSGRSPASVPEMMVSQSRKRFRTKFSSEQKEKMHELSERLGWRMQKRDEGMLEGLCREIGVTTGVFKVWMHNNKHQFFGGAAPRVGGPGIQGIHSGNGSGNDNGHGHVSNGSSSSS